ncbi:unnamed protein product [marine sediment metagenome]|uniref:SIS domain-containing protein n=1 Tax=marine sediment metagenome TaxID=412755 RepID=X1EMW6_9ZZZZ
MSKDISKRFNDTMTEIAEQIEKISTLVDKDIILGVINLIIDIHKNGNRIFVYGAGRSGFIGRCFAQRLMHLGIKSCFISDAVTPQYTEKDLLIIISGSGETTSSVAMALKSNKIRGKLALFTANPNSIIGKISNITIEIKGKSKDVAISEESLAPYTSLFDISTLSILDSICGTLMFQLGITETDIDKRHATLE